MEEQITPGQIAKKYGLIYALVSTVINLTPILIENADTGLSFLFTFINVVMAVLFFVLAGREFKKLNGGYMTFGEAFKINMIAASILAIVRSGVVYVYVKVIDSDYADRMVGVMEDMWEAQGMTAEQIDQARGFSSMFVSPEAMLFMGILGAILGGLIWGAISAAITKNEVDEF